HPGDALLVHEVDDQLELVQALEVREPGVVAGAHQRLVARPDQLRDPPAQDRLLAEQAGLALLLARGLDHPGPRGARALPVGASATGSTSRPSWRASSAEEDSGRRPTTTSTPESFRFRAWAWPCEP